MQAVQGETLAGRAASIQIRAYAICGKCETSGQAFKIAILECGCTQARCFSCGEIWEAPDRKSNQDTGGNQAVDNRGDESGNMVSSSKGKTEEWIIDPSRWQEEGDEGV